jgi:hypothetical protein
LETVTNDTPRSWAISFILTTIGEIIRQLFQL